MPSSLAVDTSFGPETKTIGVALGSPVSQVKAMFRHVGDASFSAGAQIDGVPTAVNLVIGKQDGGQGLTPDLYSRS